MSDQDESQRREPFMVFDVDQVSSDLTLLAFLFVSAMSQQQLVISTRLKMSLGR